MTQYIFHSDCRYFKGFMPCKPHKDYGVVCNNCDYYDKTTGIILIIKLGAIGDVIRTTTLLPRIKKEFPDKKIWWLTYSPEVIPKIVDNVFGYNSPSIEILKSIDFDLVINLDKDLEAVALAKNLKTKELKGFTLQDNVPFYANHQAEHKYLTGLFDDLNKSNQLSYPEEIYQICGWEFNKEEYILDINLEYEWQINNENKTIVGLNTGCGARWVSRLWSDNNWIELIKLIQDNNFFPILLGGKQEDEKNRYFQTQTNALYLGYFDLDKFISLVNKCDIVVSAVTMGMHIAIALRKQLILMNNIFNPKEFELYGRGEIVMPDKECKCFFSPKCKNPEYFCMDYLSPNTIFNAILRANKNLKNL